MTNEQGLLFTINPRELADEIGVDWWTVLKLHDDGFLSFDPETESITTVGQEDEFKFLAFLTRAGCDPRMLSVLVKDLSKPYDIDLNQHYFDWRSLQWERLPEQPDAGTVVEDYLGDLCEDANVAELQELKENIQSMLNKLKG